MLRHFSLAADDSRDAMLHQSCSEVLKGSKLHSSLAEFGEDLLVVSRMDRFHGRKVHNRLPFDDQVGSKSFSEPWPLLFDRTRNPTFNRHPRFRRLTAQVAPYAVCSSPGLKSWCKRDGMIEDELPISFSGIVLTPWLREMTFPGANE